MAHGPARRADEARKRFRRFVLCGPDDRTALLPSSRPPGPSAHGGGPNGNGAESPPDESGAMGERSWYDECVRAATAAPSIHNTQPADRRRQLTTLDPEGREMILSVGAAVFNLRVAGREHGRTTSVQLWPDPDEPDQPDLAARVTFGAPPAAPAVATGCRGRRSGRATTTPPSRCATSHWLTAIRPLSSTSRRTPRWCCCSPPVTVPPTGCAPVRRCSGCC